jgi:hypothetical protein
MFLRFRKNICPQSFAVQNPRVVASSVCSLLAPPTPFLLHLIPASFKQLTIAPKLFGQANAHGGPVRGNPRPGRCCGALWGSLRRISSRTNTPVSLVGSTRGPAAVGREASSPDSLESPPPPPDPPLEPPPPPQQQRQQQQELIPRTRRGPSWNSPSASSSSAAAGGEGPPSRWPGLRGNEPPRRQRKLGKQRLDLLKPLPPPLPRSALTATADGPRPPLPPLVPSRPPSLQVASPAGDDDAPAGRAADSLAGESERPLSPGPGLPEVGGLAEVVEAGAVRQ